MKITIQILAASLVALGASDHCLGANVRFNYSVRSTTNNEVSDGAPSTNVYDYFVSTDSDILGVGDVSIDFDVYQHPEPVGSDTAPPNPFLVLFEPALSADSFITTPGPTEVTGGGMAIAGSSFFDATNDGPVQDFLFARLTPLDTVGGEFSGVVQVMGTAGQESFPFHFGTENTPSDLYGIPEPTENGGVISMDQSFLDGSGLFENAIRLLNDNGFHSGSFAILGEITITVTNDSFGLFDGQFDNRYDVGVVDLFLDVNAARKLPPGTVATADLLIESEFGGSLAYTLSAAVPEPTSMWLAACCGIVALRRHREYAPPCPQR